MIRIPLFRKISAGLTTAMLLAMSTVAPAAALTASPLFANSQSDACGALSQLDATQGCGSTASKTVVSNLASKVVNILSIIVGIAGVIMVVIAGFKYITSNGEASGVASAKTTLIYALIGLAVAALAQFLTHYVLSNA